MALYHLTARTGSRASGQSALSKAQYIQREDRYARVPDRVLYTTSGNLPGFAAGSASAYFEAADLYERANGRLFKEVEFALPVELEPDEQRELAVRFAGELLAGAALPYTLAIHEGRGRNPHCHVLVSERVNDGIARPASQWFRRFNAATPELGGARKSVALHPKQWLEGIREKWATLVNLALERAGFLERIDHRTLAAQGIARVPQIHLGPNVLRMEERGLGTDRGDQALRIEEGNRQIAELRSTIREIDAATRAQMEIGASADSSGQRSSPENVLPSEIEGREEHSRGAAGVRTTDSDLAGASEVDRSDTRAVRAEREAPEPPSAEPIATKSDRSAREEGEPPRAHSSPGPGATATRSAAAPAPSPEPPIPIDRTERAVSRQLAAMGCDRFDIGIRDASTGLQLDRRTWSREEVLENLAWLKHRNVRGAEIQVRPADRAGPPLVHLSPLDRGALRTLEREGHSPAVIVESAPGRYEAWLRVPDRASEAAREWIGRRLARELGSHPLAASTRAWGQLAGFTTQREPARESDGLKPFALLRGASGRAAAEGPALVREAERALGERSRGREQAPAPPEPARRPHSAEAEREATALVRREHEQLRRRGMDDPDRRDLAAARRLAGAGFERETIERAIQAASPELERRKNKDLQDYVRKTVAYAMERVRQAERERERDGPERLSRSGSARSSMSRAPRRQDVSVLARVQGRPRADARWLQPDRAVQSFSDTRLPGRCGLTLIGPCGLRVEGLDVRTAAALAVGSGASRTPLPTGAPRALTVIGSPG